LADILWFVVAEHVLGFFDDGKGREGKCLLVNTRLWYRIRGDGGLTYERTGNVSSCCTYLSPGGLFNIIIAFSKTQNLNFACIVAKRRVEKLKSKADLVEQVDVSNSTSATLRANLIENDCIDLSSPSSATSFLGLD